MAVAEPVCVEPLTHDQRRRLDAAVEKRRAAYDRYLESQDESHGALAFEAECDLCNLMHLLGVQSLGEYEVG